MAFQLNKIRACYPGFYQLPELVSPAPGDGAAVVAAHVAPHHVRLVIWWWGYKYFLTMKFIYSDISHSPCSPGSRPCPSPGRWGRERTPSWRSLSPPPAPARGGGQMFCLAGGWVADCRAAGLFWNFPNDKLHEKVTAICKSSVGNLSVIYFS